MKTGYPNPFSTHKWSDFTHWKATGVGGKPGMNTLTREVSARIVKTMNPDETLFLIYFLEYT